jgi:hypothetical protein
MPIFQTQNPSTQVIPDGCYVAKVIEAKERVSSNGNSMIIMKLQLAENGGILPCCLTFVDSAQRAINAFCDSAELVRPSQNGAAVNLRASDCLGRYLYITIVNEDDGNGGDPFPKIYRFLTRKAALIKAPELAKIILHKQKPLQLEVI